jgi:hypothetical protein
VAATARAVSGVMAVSPDERSLPTRGDGRRIEPSRTLLSGALTLLACGLAMTLSGCGWVSGWFGNDDTPKPQAVSVFKVAVGQCFATPEKPQTEITDLQAVPCDGPHRQEAYASLAYQQPAGVQGDAYPGDALLANYANAACAEAFQPYVGVSYLNSSLYFTFLVPSARGWQESDDRAVICFATTTGEELTASVKGSRW